MAKAGGPANAHGILYQILGTLGRGLSLSLQGSVSGEDFAQATLVIEPADGGDVQVITGGKCTVEQWKTRSHNRPWSLREVIEKVLPDLYLATPKEAVEYRFVTSGRLHTFALASEFFRSLKEPPAATLPSSALDDTEAVSWASGGFTGTRQWLFLQVVEAVRRRPKTAAEEPQATQRRVWHLLSRFQVVPAMKLSNLINDINERLTEVINHIEDVDAKRNELCGIILNHCARGDVNISAEKLLDMAGLKPDSFLAWEKLRATLRDRLHKRLAQSGYDVKLDVRSSPPVPANHSVIVVTGQSGQGKSWTLAALAQQVAEGLGLVVWVTCDGAAHADQIASDEIWRGGLNHDGSLPLERLVDRRYKVNPNAPLPWALICVDGVQSKREAGRLASLPWEEWGMRFAMSAPEEVAAYVETQRGGRMQRIDVTDFSPLELHDYLARRSRNWSELPEDVRELIRRPILARLFADLPAGPWLPHNEYQLMEACWQRIRDLADGQVHDIAAMRTLAGRLLCEPLRYPWSPETLTQCELSPQSLDNLKQSGWLRETSQGDVECGHDRLLCWAVSQAIALRIREGDWSVQAAGQWLASLGKQSDGWSRRLGYVAMDVLWLICDESMPKSIRDAAWELIALNEPQGPYGQYARDTYRELLPTLGRRIIQPAIDRLKHGEPAPGSPFPRLVELTLCSVARHDPAPVKQAMMGCIESDQLSLRLLGIRLLSHLPVASQLDRLWSLFPSSLAAARNDPALHYQEHQRLRRALTACLQLDPSWILRAVREHQSDSALLAELATLLAATHGPKAIEAWRDVKRQLLSNTLPDDRRGLISCVLAFRDCDELPKLVEWAKTGSDWAGSQALLHVAFFDPEKAVELVGEVPAMRLAGHTGKLRELLMGLRPLQACEAVRTRILNDPDEARAFLEVAAAGDRIDAKTLDAIIDLAERRLRDYLNGRGSDDGPAFQAIHVLDSLHGRLVLDVLRRHRDLPFERLLTEAACRRTKSASQFSDHTFGASFHVLQKIGGNGVTAVVNAMLVSPGKSVRLAGCEHAWIRPDDQTRQRVASLAASDESPEIHKGSIPLVQQDAIDALAAMGANLELIRSVIRWGFQISPDVAELRSNQHPMTDEEMVPALAILEDPDHDEFPHAVLALGFTGRLDLRSRLKRLFLDSAHDSAVAKASMLALEDLGGYDPDLRERLVFQYRSGHFKYPTVRLMATAPEQDAPSLMREALRQEGPYDNVDHQLIEFLASRAATRPLVETQVRRIIESDKFFPPLMYSLPDFLDPENPADHERLCLTASKSKTFVHVVGEKAHATRRLAEVNPGLAFDLAETTARHEEELDEIAPVMLSIDRSRAMPVLLDVAVQSYSESGCRLVALAIRTCDAAEAFLPFLKAMLWSDDPRRRLVGACTAGYLGPDYLSEELERLVLSSGDINACCMAISALRRQQREAEGRLLVPRFIHESDGAALAVAEEVLHLVDPAVLQSGNDLIGFIAALRNKPFVLRKLVSKRLGDRATKVKSDLGSLLNRWEDDD